MKSLMLRFGTKSMNEESIKQRIADLYTKINNELRSSVLSLFRSAGIRFPQSSSYGMEYVPIEGESILDRYGATPEAISQMNYHMTHLMDLQLAHSIENLSDDESDDKNLEILNECMERVSYYSQQFTQRAHSLLSGMKSISYRKKSANLSEQQARQAIANVFGRICEQLGHHYQVIMQEIPGVRYPIDMRNQRIALQYFQRGGLSGVVLDQLEEVFVMLEDDAIAFVMRHGGEEYVDADELEEITEAYRQEFRIQADNIMQQYLQP